jgi:L-threonylcarbamoyladenylate synthase
VRTIRADEPGALEAAVGVLAGGGLVACPTETYYALVVRYDDEEALRRVFSLKGRAPEKAVPLIIGSVDDLPTVAAECDGAARALMERHWPGPLTLLFPARAGLPEAITSEGSVAVRVPGESFALRLARAAGVPLTATSANPSGDPPARNAEMVVSYFGSAPGLLPDILIDGGEAPGGLPSTIVQIVGGQARVLREGAVKMEAV